MGAAKQLVNRYFKNEREEFSNSQEVFWERLSDPAVRARIGEYFAEGFNSDSRFELELGTFIGPRKK